MPGEVRGKSLVFILWEPWLLNELHLWPAVTRIKYNLVQCGGNSDCTATLKVTERCTSRQQHYLRGGSAFFLDTKENVGQTLRSDIISVTLCRCSAAALLSHWTMDVFLWSCELNCCHYKLCSRFSVQRVSSLCCWVQDQSTTNSKVSQRRRKKKSSWNISLVPWFLNNLPQGFPEITVIWYQLQGKWRR